MVEPDLRRVSADRAGVAIRARLWPALAVACGALAYRPLLASALQAPTARQVESWLFRPSQLPLLLVLAVAGWLLWRRRDRLLALPDRRHRGATAALALSGASLFVWAILTRSIDPLLLSLAANLLAFGSAARGWAGARALLLPALAALLGVRIPTPLLSEIVWALQRATAIGSARLLDWVGRDVVQEGVILHSGEHSFQVIDGCSGLQGITTLVLAAILVGELLALSGLRRAALLALAPLLGYALNAVRIAIIAASPDPEAYAGLGGDHTPQGVALLALGTALLYGIGRALAPSAPASGGPHPGRAAQGPPWRTAAIALAALAAISAALAPFDPPAPVSRQSVRFPEARAVWKSEPLQGDPFFLGTGDARTRLFRRYQRGATPGLIDTIDLLIVYESDGATDSGHLLSSKSRWPGPNWNLLSRGRARIWDLALDADLTVAAHATGPERAVILCWRIRDGGRWRESARSLFALDASPFRRGSQRAVVQLVAYSPWQDDPVALDRARARLDRFITIFRDDLEAL